MKIAIIVEGQRGAFVVEYDTTEGKKGTMRLDADTYEEAVQEAKSFLGLNENNHDGDGNLWDVE